MKLLIDLLALLGFKSKAEEKASVWIVDAKPPEPKAPPEKIAEVLAKDYRGVSPATIVGVEAAGLPEEVAASIHRQSQAHVLTPNPQNPLDFKVEDLVPPGIKAKQVQADLRKIDEEEIARKGKELIAKEKSQAKKKPKSKAKAKTTIKQKKVLRTAAKVKKK